MAVAQVHRLRHYHTNRISLLTFSGYSVLNNARGDGRCTGGVAQTPPVP